MHVGVMISFQNHWNSPRPDREIYENELRIAGLVEPLGFDSIWSLEHHFTDYTLCPNPIQFGAYMAGRTRRIQLGTAAVILPWHKDPLRVATDFAMLDNLSGGRALVGLGRGIGRVEYEGFGIDMSESRERWEESLGMILGGLETGTMAAHQGKYYQQVERPIRPAPFGDIRDKLFIVSMSPDTIPYVAEYGAAFMTFAIAPWERRSKDVKHYQELFEAKHQRPAPPISANMFVYVDQDSSKAKEMATKYIGDYWQSAVQHYEMTGDHFAAAGKSYEFYAKSATALRDHSDAVTQGYIDNQIWGTPADCIEKIRAITDLCGEIQINCQFCYAGMPYDVAEQNMRVFARDVLPTLKAS